MNTQTMSPSHARQHSKTQHQLSPPKPAIKQGSQIPSKIALRQSREGGQELPLRQSANISQSTTSKKSGKTSQASGNTATNKKVKSLNKNTGYSKHDLMSSLKAQVKQNHQSITKKDDNRQSINQRPTRISPSENQPLTFQGQGGGDKREEEKQPPNQQRNTLGQFYPKISEQEAAPTDSDAEDFDESEERDKCDGNSDSGEDELPTVVIDTSIEHNAEDLAIEIDDNRQSVNSCQNIAAALQSMQTQDQEESKKKKKVMIMSVEEEEELEKHILEIRDRIRRGDGVSGKAGTILPARPTSYDAPQVKPPLYSLTFSHQNNEQDYFQNMGDIGHNRDADQAQNFNSASGEVTGAPSSFITLDGPNIQEKKRARYEKIQKMRESMGGSESKKKPEPLSSPQVKNKDLPLIMDQHVPVKQVMSTKNQLKVVSNNNKRPIASRTTKMSLHVQAQTGDDALSIGSGSFKKKISDGSKRDAKKVSKKSAGELQIKNINTPKQVTKDINSQKSVKNVIAFNDLQAQIQPFFNSIAYSSRENKLGEKRVKSENFHGQHQVMRSNDGTEITKSLTMAQVIQITNAKLASDKAFEGLQKKVKAAKAKPVDIKVLADFEKKYKRLQGVLSKALY